MMSRTRTWLWLLVAAGVMAAGCTSGSAPPADATEITPATSEPVVLALLKEPSKVGAFSLTDLTGNVITGESLRGKVVLVNFWATWCPPCRAEIPDLIALQAKYRDRLVILGISEDEGPVDEVKAFVAAQKMNYPVAMTTPELSRVFKGVSALPTTFVIDRDGLIQQKHIGLLHPEVTELETQVLSGMKTNARIERTDDPTKVLLQNAAQAKEIPGVDLASMTPAARTAALKALNAEDCTCGCELTLAACRINDPTCGVSLPIAQELAKKIAASTH
jgi:thiol-disulfide isomerase/thioredoxin